ncbi:MAG TPA: response regulator [Gemmatimonadaceae bacterium]|jgi:PAS domain S-box-containing protein
MPRFLTIPHEPLARFRLLSAGFAATIAFLNVGMFAFGSQFPEPYRWEAAVAAALLGAWWLWGYRRGGFPTIGWLVDLALVVAVAVESPMPLRAIGLFYAGIQFRALYVTRRELALLTVTYAVARVLSIAIAPGDVSFTALSGTSVVQILGLTVIAVTLHLFAEATQRHTVIERALKHSDERYRLVAGAMHDVVYDWDVATSRIEWTESMYHVFGFTPQTVGTELMWWLARVHPRDRDMLEHAISNLLADPTTVVESVQYRVRRADESYAYVSWSMIVQRAASGAAERVIGSIRDITSEQQLEEQLRQSQKMEAVGQLAGGVAHDFNNLLTVIGGHVFMLERSIQGTATSDKHLGGITRAADRAAALTKQLLAFSRKQILTPSVLNLNAVVDDALQMMRPVIGEHIQIVTQFDSTLAPVFADAGQLTQVLVNLALNARDAMPGGGLLTIVTENVTLEPRTDDANATSLPAGDYVRLIMRDSGTGMNVETLARAFEPFFTTKSQGQGSGLGLATVYGIIKQSFGDIQASSTVGTGSSFTILLPIVHRPVELPGMRPAAAPVGDVSEQGAGKQRSLLLVEDDDGVREFAQEVLSRAGYRVQSARNGVDALEQTREHDLTIDVVVTDVVMPEMGGRELAQHLRRRRPDLPILYITGYTDDARMLGELYSTEARLLEKPFTASALEMAVEEVVDGTRRSAARI